METYCDNCGRNEKLKKVVLEEEKGTALYCDECRKNNKRQTVEEWKKENNIEYNR